VSVAPAAASDPAAPAVVTMLSRYFTDISTRNFADYLALFTPEMRATIDTRQLAAGYRSTQDSHARLASLAVGADGRPAATVTFVST
jgi:hypothetical protein